MTSDDDYDDLLAGLDDLDEFEESVKTEVLYDPDEEEYAGFPPVKGREYVPPAPEPVEVAFSRSNKRPSAIISTPATKTSEAIRRPLMSGHCAFPQSHEPDVSHRRCRGYSRANPENIFQPCPDLCHYPAEQYECGACGGTIVEAPHYPLDEDGDVRYVHVDMKRKRATDCECPR